VFGGVLSSANGATPSFDQATLKCSNTYCHGATLASNQATPPPTLISSPAWDTPFPAGQTHCDKCHGYPPFTNEHSNVTTPTQCIGCHPHVNAAGTGFSDASKHINGTIDVVSAHVFPNPGSLHKVSSSGCTACHSLSSGSNPYPVAVGTPPTCRACHLSADPGTDPQCSDCHGDAASGRPNLNSVLQSDFPNRAGLHIAVGAHSSRTCTVCHPFTSGDARHGWSNRTRSANAQVLPTLNWNPGTRAVGQGTCNPAAGGFVGCHGIHTGWY
jgi:predicted CxxxxCH...CXXCH cytochrome family protein